MTEPAIEPASRRAAPSPPAEPAGDLPALRSELVAGAVLARSGPLFAGFAVLVGLLAALLVPFGGWRPLIAVPLLVPLTAGLVAAVRLIPARPAPSWTAPACVAVAVAHAAWAAATHAEHVVLRRDAGSYALYTQWIASRHGLPVGADLDAFGGPAALADPAFRLASPAFYAVLHGAAGSAGRTADLVPQFLLGAPAVFSLGWWTAGWGGLLVVPAIASGLAVLAVAGLAARLCGARWAPLAALALAICQPVLHAARSTYSEPLALLLIAAAAALLVDAVRVGNGQVGGRTARWLALAAGLGFGLAALVRVDAIREVSLLFPVAAVLARRAHPAARPLVIGALAGTAVAAVPALLLSRPYLGSIAGSLLPLLAGGVLLAGLSLLLVVLGRRERGRQRLTGGVWDRRWPRLSGGAVVALGLLLASRPLWLVTRQSAADPGSRVVAGLQLRQGLPVDGGRTYAEHSLTWVSWYLGPVVVIAAWLALAVLAARATRWWLATGAPGRPAETVPVWLGPAVIALGSTVLTLYRPGITPDHPWADRRLVPLVLPAAILAATAAAAWAGRFARRHWPASLLLGLLLVSSLALVLPAALATAPVAGQRTERGELAATRTVCDRLRAGDVVLAVDSRGSNEWPQVVRGICGRPAGSVKVTLGTGDDARPVVRRVAARIAATGHRPVLLAGTAEGAALLAGLGLAPEQVVDLHTVEDQRYLTRVPDGGDPLAVQVWLAPFTPGNTG